MYLRSVSDAKGQLSSKVYILRLYYICMFVSNSSTLILLAKIDLLNALLEHAPKILISDVIEKEMAAKRTFDAQLIAREIERGSIAVVCSDLKKARKVMEQFHLDLGEASAYALFNPGQHSALLTDDGELIKLCKLERIPFICAMGIVVRLYEKGVLTKEETLEKMEALVRVGRYAPSIYDHFKQEVR